MKPMTIKYSLSVHLISMIPIVIVYVMVAYLVTGPYEVLTRSILGLILLVNLMSLVLLIVGKVKNHEA